MAKFSLSQQSLNMNRIALTYSVNKMTKILLVSGLSIIGLISIAITPVRSQNIDSQENNLTPRKLISLARQGRFNAQGIPGYSRFGSLVRSGKVNAEKLVTSAIAQNRLPKSALHDSDFISAVEEHLKSGGCSSN